MYIGIQYTTTVYPAVRNENMKLIRNKSETLRLNPLMKRVLITKGISDCHERLARDDAFRRAFIITGSQLPVDQSADDEVCLQGFDFDFKTVCTSSAIAAKKHKIEAKKDKRGLC